MHKIPIDTAVLLVATSITVANEKLCRHTISHITNQERKGGGLGCLELSLNRVCVYRPAWSLGITVASLLEAVTHHIKFFYKYQQCLP